MILNKVKIYGEPGTVNIYVDGRTISRIEDSNKEDHAAGEHRLRFDNAVALPGLINSHDHLEFNLFPRFGDGLFNNYLDWSSCISRNYEREIKNILQIPLRLRILWGIYKNLLCGVTTVVHHGKPIAVDHPEIDVFQDYHFLHSVGLEKRWKYKLNKFSSRKKLVIHLGEGHDACAHEEIDRLIRWNIFKKEVVAVHGVAMNPRQAKSLTALVWCPYSNFFMLNETAKIDQLKNELPVVFGTDSTLTADWNLWEHLRLAKKRSSISNDELFNMLTVTPAKIWGLKNQGAIKKDFIADIVIAENANDDLTALNPGNILLVLKNGVVKVFDEKLLNQLGQGNFNQDNYSEVWIDQSRKFVHGDLRGLMADIKKYYPAVAFPVAVEA